MRLDCIKDLYSLLGVLGNQGYSVPFKDYDKELKDFGLLRHIHNYRLVMESINSKEIKLSIIGDFMKTYEIIVKKNDVPYTNKELEDMHNLENPK